MKRTGTVVLALALWAGLSVPTAAAQWAEEEEAKAAAMGVITELFDAMRAADSATVRSLIDPGANLGSSFANAEGEPGVSYGSIDGFVNAVGGAGPGDFDEQIGESELRAYDNLVTVSMPYVFYHKQTLSHCGVNTFQIARTSEAWKVVGIIDTRRRQDCEGWLQ